MKRLVKRLLAVWILLGIAVVLPALAVAGDKFKKAPETCKNAYAVLGWSKFQTKEQHETAWRKVGWILGRRKFLKQVDTPEAGVVHQVSFRQYDVKGVKGGHGYVAHCGHGGTCNIVADALFRLYKGIGTPRVYCGKLPSVLINPTKPEIPIPTDEELAEAGGGDEEFGDDDDDDDDDF
jgi:hypothetical protein